MTSIVMVFNMAKINGSCDVLMMIEKFGVVHQGLDIAFEMSKVNGIEARQGCEKADICLG